MGYINYKHFKKMQIHFFGETILKDHNLTERYQFLIFRMPARRKTRAGPYTTQK